MHGKENIMSNGSLRVKSSTQYTIEVNDKGEEISIDLNDTGLPAKLMMMIEDIQNEEKSFNKNVEELIKREDKEVYNGITQNMLDFYKAQDDMCNKCRKYIDKIFGEEASRKIFGGTNSPQMFEDFFEQIRPHLDKAGLSVQKMQRQLVKKYKPNNKKVL